jgi:hypothetical protein
MRSWFGNDFANEMAMALLASVGIDTEKRQRLERRICEDTLERLSFRVVPVVKATEDEPYDTVIVNEKGEILSLDEKLRLEDTYKEVKAEYAQRMKAVKEAEEAAKRREAALRQAEYDAIAAPYREERRRKKAAMFAKQQPKEHHGR